MTRSWEGGSNWALEEAKRNATSTKSPTEILAEMLAAEKAKPVKDTKRIKDIEQAQKYAGTRNIQKRKGGKQ